MRVNVKMTVVTYALLALASIVAFTLPTQLGTQTTMALPNAGPSMMRMHGVLRDFKSGHPDFGVALSGGNGHYAGSVVTTLGGNGRPTFAGGSGGAVTDFEITGGSTVPKVAYTPMVTVIGAAIVSGSYDVPVTVNVHIGNATIAPFGAFDQALAGNVNKAGNPRKYIQSAPSEAKSEIWVEGTSWLKKNASSPSTKESDWKTYLSFSSKTASKQVKVLRNGDKVPDVAGFKNQVSLKSYIKSFIDAKGEKVVLEKNQTIYLFELGTTDTNSSAADFQDLVVLVTLAESTSYLNTLDAYGKPVTNAPAIPGYKVAGEWRDAKGNNIAPHLFSSASNDVAGSKGAASTGGIKSGATFDQWFADTLGVNLSGMHDIVLTKNTQGVWEYVTNEFFPADDVLSGNEGAAHNYLFTYVITSTFTHHAGEHRFIEFSGADDAWVFVDGKLGIDLGGVIPDKAQYLDVDRLGLSDGQKYTLNLFYAQRNTSLSKFRLRTNLDLGQDSTPYTITGIGD